MALTTSRARSALRRLKHRRSARSDAGDFADLNGVISTFSSIDILCRTPAGIDPRTVQASLNPSKGAPISGIPIHAIKGNYRIELPVAHLSRLEGDMTFALWLESGSRRWRLGRSPSPARKPVSVPSAVYRCGDDSIRVRITSNAAGALAVHTHSLSRAA